MATNWTSWVGEITSTAMLQLIVLAFAFWALQFLIPETNRQKQRKLNGQREFQPISSAKKTSLTLPPPSFQKNTVSNPTRSRSLQIRMPSVVYGREPYSRDDPVGNLLLQQEQESEKLRIDTTVDTSTPPNALVPVKKPVLSRQQSCVPGHSSVVLIPRNHAPVQSRRRPFSIVPTVQSSPKIPACLPCMPLEVLRRLASYLPSLSLMCFAVTCRAAYEASRDRCTTIGSLDLLATEAFLLIWERELANNVYCHNCMQLHRFEVDGKEVTLRPCPNPIEDFCLGRYRLPYLVARLAVNRHIYGERCGVPLHVLRMCRRVDDPAPGVQEDGWAVMQMVQARVTGDGKLVVASTWTLYKRSGTWPRPMEQSNLLMSRRESITDGRFGIGGGGFSRTRRISQTQMSSRQSSTVPPPSATTSRQPSTSRPLSSGWPQSMSRNQSFSQTRRLIDKVTTIRHEESDEQQGAALEYENFERAVARFSEHLGVCPSTHQWNAYRVMSGKVAEFADPRQLEPAYGEVRSCLKCLTDYEVNIIEGVAPDQHTRYYDKRPSSLLVNSAAGSTNGANNHSGSSGKRVQHTNWVLSMTKYCYLGRCRSQFEERWPGKSGNGLDGKRMPEKGATVRDMWLRGGGQIGTIGTPAELPGMAEARREHLKCSSRSMPC